MQNFLFYAFSVIIVVLATAIYVWVKNRSSLSSAAVLDESVEAGLTEPASLHPVLDLSVCVGSGACAITCPEKALGVIKGKSVLVNPSYCIGHGACEAACPVGAIKLVFGTARRGMDIPEVNPNFETNVPGIFIAGELGGMGLIRKAVEQGRQAMSHIIKRCKNNKSKAEYDVIIVGAGPAGISGTLAAKQAGLRYLTIEQEETLGGSALHYPRNKIVMTAPMDLPIIGKVSVREISKKALIELWDSVVKKSGIRITYGTSLEKLEHAPGIINVVTSKGTYTATCVLLAIGRRGTPRRLEVPGEELSKVVYRLIEPEQFRGNNALVVGGGDSALEAALLLAEEPGTRVTLSYRSDSFGRVKAKNRERIEAAERAGKISVLLSSQVQQIAEASVTLTHAGKPAKIPNDVVIICAGGVLPTSLLKEVGIKVDTHYGT